MQNTYKPMTLTGSLTAQAVGTYNELVVDSMGRRHIIIQRVTIKRTAGTAANYQPLITNGDGVSGTVGQLYLGASTAVADIFDVTNIAGYSRTDSNGSIWLNCQPDAGTDNTFDYEIHLGVW